MSSTTRRHGFNRQSNCFSCPFLLVVTCLTTLLIFYIIFVLRFFSNNSSSTSSPSVLFHKPTSPLSPPRTAPIHPADLPNDEDDNLHLVFNTGCNLFQHWQAQALMASALQVNQRGWITRIVSGCDYNDTSEVKTVWTHPRGLSDRMVPLDELNRSVFPRFRLHLTPVFEGAREYPYLNKPQSLEHWVKYAFPKITQDIVAILDPDFIFVTSLTVNGEGEVLFSGRDQPGSHKVSKGHPVAQKYGIGSQWVKHSKQVCGESSPCAKVTGREAEQHYQVGAPYLLHREDFAAMMPFYTVFMKAYVKLKGPGILSDMYAYSMAAAHLNLPHTIFDHFMVSCVDCGGEGWSWVDLENHNVCSQPYNIPNESPVFLHYCHNYNNDDVDQPMFHKGHVPPNILDCDQPSVIEAPNTFVKQQVSVHNKRNAWMVCMIIPRLNMALEHYKSAYCKNPDFSKRFRLIHGEQSHSCDGDTEGKTCWVYADKKEEGYQWPGKPLPYEFVGCFADKKEERDFPHSMMDVSIDECWEKAKEEKAEYFALQYGGECFWGDSYGRHGESTQCGSACMKGGGICGGYYVNSVYKV